MPVYKYKAINSDGSNKEGVIDAESVKAASEKLKQQGLYLSSISEAPKSGKRSYIPFRGVSSSELAITTRQFASLISAGLPLEASLVALSEQTEDPKIKEVFTQVRNRVNEGSSLANALSEHSDVFSKIYINIINAGEVSGNLDIVLNRLADFMEKSTALKSKIQSAFVYPIFMFIVGSGVMFFMMIYVIPKISKIFEASEKALPLSTLILMTISNFLIDNLAIMLILPFLIGFVLMKFVRSERGKRFTDILILKLPIFGKLISKIAISRFARTTGTLVGSGIPLLNALEVGEAVMGNSVFADSLAEVRISVREGSDLASPLHDSKVFPPLVTRMISVGEQTGEIENMFNKIADIYDLQVENTLSALTSLLEPIMILAIGAVMAFIVFAILLPIFDLTSVI